MTVLLGAFLLGLQCATVLHRFVVIRLWKRLDYGVVAAPCPPSTLWKSLTTLS